MKIRYFTDSDTLYIEFRDRPITETRDLDENTVLDVDADGNICAIRATAGADLGPRLSRRTGGNRGGGRL